MAEFDCRIVAMLSVAVSLLLLGSVILIRLHHHQHRHQESPPLPSEALVKNREEVSSTTAPPPLPPTSTFRISDECLQCMCQVENGCKTRTCLGGVPCGTFRITESYWVDAGKPTKDGTPIALSDSRREYTACVNSPECATRTVNAYVSAYIRDCNEDGVIDCADYLLIHHFGPSGCLLNENLRPESMLERCLRGSSE